MFKETSVKLITIPGSIKNIGERAFANCKKLQKATINEGVKKISKEAFSCTTLEEITIPSTVTELGKNAFRWDSTEKSSLKKVVIRSKNIKKWGTMVFGATRDDLVIYVPQSKKAEYEKILRSTNGSGFSCENRGKELVKSGGRIMAKQGRIFAVIFLALLIPVLLKAPESEAKVYRGKCKSNLAWSYDSKTKTMVIDCKGDMPDDKQFYGLDMGWKEYYLQTKKVVFKEGIKSIGAGAFEKFQNLESIVLPRQTLHY